MMRLATLQDVDAINELIQKSAKYLCQDQYSTKEIAAALRYVFGADTLLIADETYYVIEENKKLIACGGWSKRKTLFGGNQYENKNPELLNPETDPAKIRAFFVSPSHARRGYGKKLLNFCELNARAAGFSKMEMMATLTGAKLYETCGYVLIKEEIVTLPDESNLRFKRMLK